MIAFLRFTIFLFFTVSTIAYAESPSADVSTLLNSVRSMRANFNQTVTDNRGKVTQRSYGRMHMQRPGKLRWEVTKPMPQLIVANQSRLWIYDADLEQVTIRSLRKATGETPALLLTEVNTVLDKDYTVKQLPNRSAGMKWFLLTPKNNDNMFASIQMGFTNDKIKQMNLQDHLGHITQIQFSNTETNIPLSSSLFVFKAPRNVDVIDETRKR